jgi:hypothetical protein
VRTSGRGAQNFTGVTSFSAVLPDPGASPLAEGVLQHAKQYSRSTRSAAVMSCVLRRLLSSERKTSKGSSVWSYHLRCESCAPPHGMFPSANNHCPVYQVCVDAIRGGREEFKCPIDKSTTQISRVATNFFVRDLVEDPAICGESKAYDEEKDDGGKSRICDVCETHDGEPTAVSFCMNCRMLMCEDATAFHKRAKASKDHKVGPNPDPISAGCA